MECCDICGRDLAWNEKGYVLWSGNITASGYPNTNTIEAPLCEDCGEDLKEYINRERRSKSMGTQRVIFRKFKDEGDIIAFLPDNPANPGMVDSYQHLGQHGEADYYGLLNTTSLATPTEYADLLSELKSIGYDLRVVKKLNRNQGKPYKPFLDKYIVTNKDGEPMKFESRVILYIYLRKQLAKVTGEDILTKEKFNGFLECLKGWKKVNIKELGEDLRRGPDYDGPSTIGYPI